MRKGFVRDRAKVLRNIAIAPEGCWEWQRYRSPNGYGRIKHDGVMEYAHRYSFIAHGGEIPDGLYVLHSCDNRRCVNPDHLHAGTHAENLREMVERHRQCSGERNGRSKITDQDAAAILDCLSRREPKNDVARRFGISRWSVDFLAKGKTWRHIARSDGCPGGTNLSYG